ncbi:MAG: hypothetical protein AAFV54_05840 [Pseudomonadota bacterium]
MPRTTIIALMGLLAALPVSAQQYASNEYRVCPAAQTERGVSVVEATCGQIRRPDFVAMEIESLSDLRQAETQRDTFRTQVTEYGTCINAFINSYRRPGADATSTAPDEAACAHAWAEDQVTQSVMEFGRACIDFSNRSMTDRTIEPWSGSCYPTATDRG